ncbi:hypothetical protein [Paracoccus pantotrophus]|uniref:hypothetical protein n=1 Tax=Paracoccus pantotrophus TaxID=82367 RepID=UPI0008EC18AA|nr:hypothetical protein [Paracoccus pantotrophus]MDF3855838.1 hypothetical protein [Paracoccus pantotrophus]SFO82903.1 hypothetical protein SAMN04244567_03200 [Paracoccus pantotrophus]
MEDQMFEFRIQMERADADLLRKACEADLALAREEAGFGRIDDQFTFGKDLTVIFTNLMPGPHSLLVVALRHPEGMRRLARLVDQVTNPIQFSMPDQGEILILPPRSLDEYGPEDVASGTMTFKMLMGLTEKGLRTLFVSPDVGAVDDRQELFYNPAYLESADGTIMSETGESELQLARYEYILSPSDLTSEQIFFDLWGVAQFRLGEDHLSAYYVDEARELRICAFRIDYEEGRFWTITVSAPDLGDMRSNPFSVHLAERALLKGGGIKVFGILLTDDLHENLITQEFRSVNGKLEAENIVIFNAAE